MESNYWRDLGVEGKAIRGWILKIVIRCDNVEWIDVALDRNKCRAVVDRVMSLCVL
jgi:hypothetical protein